MRTVCQRNDIEVSVVPVWQLWTSLEGGHIEEGYLLVNQIAKAWILLGFVWAMREKSMLHCVSFQWKSE